MQLPSRRRPMVLVGIVIGGILVSVTAGVVTWSVLDIISSDASTPPPKRDHSTSQQTGDEPKSPQPKVVEFDKQAHSHDTADSIWVVVNK